MNNIYLIGMMASGKSIVGEKLAKILDMEHIDIDNDIEAINETKISDIFNESGEQKFREMESAYFIEKSKQKNNIFSTGGGIILNKHNRSILKNDGTTFFLEADCQILLDRIHDISERPLLNRDNPINSILSIWKQREKYYYESSDYTINSNRLSINDVVNQIIIKMQ